MPTEISEKPVEYFQQKSKEKNIKRWNMHNCSMCGYQCGFVIHEDGSVGYDAGCYCVNGEERPSEWESIADHYNRNIPKNNPHSEGKQWLKDMIEFWS